MRKTPMNFSQRESTEILSQSWAWLFGLLFLGLGWMGLGCLEGRRGGDHLNGQAFLLAAPPEGVPVDVVALKNKIQRGEVDAVPAGNSADQSSDGQPSVQTMIGRVGGGLNETWDKEKASFLLRDLSLPAASSHAHGGHDDNCKFCQAEKAQQLESMVLVQMVGEDRQVVSGDARKLLGLQENQTVIVEGEGDVDDGGTFVFRARKIYIQR